jgi:hypothetical protein
MGRNSLGPRHTPSEGAYQIAGASFSAGQAAYFKLPEGIFILSSGPALESSSEGSAESWIPC